MRIVSLLSSATEILFGLGIGEQVVAISHECDYSAAAVSLPRATRSLIDSCRTSREIDAQVKSLLETGDSLYEIDRDLIRRLQPDLIVTQAQCDVCAVRYQDVIDFVTAEPALAKTAVLALSPTSLGEILQDIHRVGDATGQPERALDYVEQLTGRVDNIAQRTGSTWPREVGSAVDPSALNRPRVICLEWTDPLMAAGNWTPEMIELAGGVSCLADAGRHSGYTRWSAVCEVNPDVLLFAPCGFDLNRSQVEARRLLDQPGFHELKAVAHGRVFVIDGNAYLNRSGPRIVDSLEILAHLIRPDVFAAPSGPLAEGRAWTRLSC